QLPSSPTLRASLLVSSVSIFITGLSSPHAFGGEGTLFAVSYAIVRFLHLALYVDAAKRGSASWSSMAGFMVTITIGMVLLIGGSFTSDWVRIALWVMAAAIDYAAPAWLTRERLRGLQHVVVAHFAERYSLFVIICLGESLVAIGVGALGANADRSLNGELVVAAALGLLITVAMWWTYFEGFAEAAAERLRRHDDPVLAAADAYSYLQRCTCSEPPRSRCDCSASRSTHRLRWRVACSCSTRSAAVWPPGSWRARWRPWLVGCACPARRPCAGLSALRAGKHLVPRTRG
ncbi:MAG: low temperature requirement protein A, partial [Solirubrobacteraceae bacterium]